MERKQRNAKRAQWRKRRTRVVKGLGRSERPRLTVFRSAKHIYAQILDPETGRTIAGVSTRTPSLRGEEGDKVAAAKRVGAAIAELAKKNKIEEVVFNRNGFLYHGRVKALAEAARESGLKF
jgi:large subunit ribosomal protein L18